MPYGCDGGGGNGSADGRTGGGVSDENSGSSSSAPLNTGSGPGVGGNSSNGDSGGSGGGGMNAFALSKRAGRAGGGGGVILAGRIGCPDVRGGGGVNASGLTALRSSAAGSRIVVGTSSSSSSSSIGIIGSPVEVAPAALTGSGTRRVVSSLSSCSSAPKREDNLRCGSDFGLREFTGAFGLTTSPPSTTYKFAPSITTPIDFASFPSSSFAIFCVDGSPVGPALSSFSHWSGLRPRMRRRCSAS